MSEITPLPSGRDMAYVRLEIVLLIPFLTMSMMAPRQKASPEYQVKAVFLFNFTQFVEWPANAFPEAHTPLIIGILGTDPFGNYLDNTVEGEKINGRPIAVQRYDNVEEAKACHILFVNVTQTNQLEKVLAGLKGHGILTVGENTGFIRQGGIVRFLEENNKIRLQINQEAARDADLTISSKLLRLAEIVSVK